MEEPFLWFKMLSLSSSETDHDLISLNLNLNLDKLESFPVVVRDAEGQARFRFGLVAGGRKQAMIERAALRITNT